MSDAFDPYRKWLGIPPDEQPPHHYRLLGVGLFEDDPEVIESAADQRMAHLRTFQTGVHSALSQTLLNEVVAAKLCLLSTDKKAAYDAELRQRLDAAKQKREVASPTESPPPFAAIQESELPLARPVAAPPAIARARPVNSPVLRSRRGASQSHAALWWSAGAGAFAVLAIVVFMVSRSSKPSAVQEEPAAKLLQTASPRRPALAETASANGRTTAPASKGKQVPAPVLAEQPAEPVPAAPAEPAPPPPAEPAPPPPAEPPLAIAPLDARQARAHQEAWAGYLKMPVEQQNSLGMRLVLIPPGEFTMGSTPEQIEAAKEFAVEEANKAVDWTLQRIDAEAPAHRVKISRPFLMGATEVTIGQYRRFVETSGYITETERFGGGSSVSKEEREPAKKSLTWRAPSYFANENSAATQITWNDAIAFCNWLSNAEKLSRCYVGDEQAGWTLSPAGNGYRLPSEAEWEYGCRAGTTTQYWFADDASSFAQFGWSDKTGAMPFPVSVGSKSPNPFGLYDMHGNVEEWCYDWFSPGYYATSPHDDPTGPADGGARVKRGGKWDAPFVNSRAAFRHSYPPFYRFGDLGFRVVRVLAAVSNSKLPASANPLASKPAAAATAPPPAIAPFDEKQARAHQEAWAAFLKRPIMQQNSIGAPLVLLPPGEFTMGSTPEQIAAAKRIGEQAEKGSDKWSSNRIETEAPAHRVKIGRPFLIGATEVSVAQYRRFVDATAYVTETERFGGGDSTKKDEQAPKKKTLNWRRQGNGNDGAAVRQITWNDAVAFCNWLSDEEKLSRCYRGGEQDGWLLEPSGQGYRLPTEAEWEYACRAGTTTQYSFGDDPTTFSQYGWSLKAGPVPNPNPVAGKLPNPFGLYDMHGNVYEWCHDWMMLGAYAQSPASDPTGPASGDTKVTRGGALDSPIVRCRTAFRSNFVPTARFWDLGFRLVRVSVANSE